MLGAVTVPSAKPSLSASREVYPPETITDLIGSPITPSANKSKFFHVSNAPNLAEETLTDRVVWDVAKNDPSDRLNSHFL